MNKFRRKGEHHAGYLSHAEALASGEGPFFIDSDCGDNLLLINRQGWLNDGLYFYSEECACYPVYPVPTDEIEFIKE